MTHKLLELVDLELKQTNWLRLIGVAVVAYTLYLFSTILIDFFIYEPPHVRLYDHAAQEALRQGIPVPPGFLN